MKVKNEFILITSINSTYYAEILTPIAIFSNVCTEIEKVIVRICRDVSSSQMFFGLPGWQETCTA